MSAVQPSAEPRIQRVSNVELFFDLVFVFAITQLTSIVVHPHGAGDYARAFLVFMTLMWMYSAYAWLTSNLAIESPWQRQLFFTAMAGFFIMALSISDVFGANGLPYALALLGVTAIHGYLFSTAPTASARAIRGIEGFNLCSALFVFAAAFVRPPWDWPLWTAAVAVMILAALQGRESGFVISPSHFVERNGLLVIVALGESVVGIGVGARELTIDIPTALTAALALMLCAAVWWTYFDADDRRAEHQFTLAAPVERARMALIGFGYAHFIMIAGIVLLAAGLEVGVAHPAGDLKTAGVWNLAAGLAIYLIGDALYRYTLRIGPGRLRLLIAALAFVSVPIGFAFGAVVQIAALLLLMQPVWLVDRKKTHEIEA